MSASTGKEHNDEVKVTKHLMNNHHDIVYVVTEGNKKAKHFVGKSIPSDIPATYIEPLKDVFVFTKEELDKRDKEMLAGRQKIKLEGNFKKPCEGCSIYCYNWKIGDCRY